MLTKCLSHQPIRGNVTSHIVNLLKSQRRDLGHFIRFHNAKLKNVKSDLGNNVIRLTICTKCFNKLGN